MLSHQLGKALKLIIEADIEGINSLQLFEAGCISAQSEISKLRKQGALIETQRRDAIDSNGEIHPSVAHYIYIGWDHSSSNTSQKGN
jgi:hypothetical protein